MFALLMVQNAKTFSPPHMSQHLWNLHGFLKFLLNFVKSR